jgi:glyoxylase-like metal-dependent hydrolase (beta-lactamase superfamily II)
MRKALAAVALLAALLALGVWQRHRILLALVANDGPPPLSAATQEGAAVRWFDDYFTIEAVDARTFAIGEPRYAQQNFSYLILGSERAVLFDAGPGFRDIRPVVESLTPLPVTFVPSHFHYDHVGNRVTFERVAVVDLPYLRARERGGRLALLPLEHLGASEGVAAPTLEVDEWLAPGASIALGERELLVLLTPGHTEESISLFDRASGQLFSGDFIYPGELYAFLPNSGMGDYAVGASNVLAAAPEALVLGAHRVGPPGAPRLDMHDVRDLSDTLRAVASGERESTGIYPVSYRVNDRIALLAEPRWLQRWQPRSLEAPR